MKWTYEKFKGDMAIYAICPKCNFVYNCGRVDLDGYLRVNEHYAFCPMCSEFLYDDKTELFAPDIAYNDRDISDMYKIKLDISTIEYAIMEQKVAQRK